jgi:phosphatidylinositol 4-kinase A
MLDAYTQVFVPSPFFREIEPSPIEALSFNLTSALLSLGINFEILHDKISRNLWSYLDNCANAAESIVSGHDAPKENESPDVEDAINTARLTISMLGFLDAAATHADFWSAGERLMLTQKVKSILSDGFLVSIETAFSTIRNTHSPDRFVKEWKGHFRHYAAIGRPLGAMLLQRSFMWLLVAGSSLLVADVKLLRGNDILDVLLSGKEMSRPRSSGSGKTTFATIETMAEIASEEMGRLEDGADYLRLGSAWQQRLAFAVKAGALTSYLNCATLDEDAANVDILMSWLEDALADPVQMADETLARVVLRCMALVAKISPALAPNVSRLLPRFIVQGGPRGQTVTVASECLAYVLRMLSQDAIITTLYTLGNVLSSGSSTEKVLAGLVNGDIILNENGNVNLYGGKQSTGSAISLETTGEEETSAVCANVVQAICVIACSCNDEKLTALAQSMLLQKITKVSKAVDTRIITKAASLAVTGGPLEFRSLLKLYGRLTLEGVAQNDNALLSAVSVAFNLTCD